MQHCDGRGTSTLLFACPCIVVVSVTVDRRESMSTTLGVLCSTQSTNLHDQCLMHWSPRAPAVASASTITPQALDAQTEHVGSSVAKSQDPSRMKYRRVMHETLRSS